MTLRGGCGRDVYTFYSYATTGGIHAIIPHMKARHVPFQSMYGRLICSKGLQSDRPKC